MLAKLIASGETRAQALQRLREALKAFAVEGVKTNIPFLLQVLDSPDYIEGRLDIGLAARVLADPARAVATLHS